VSTQTWQSILERVEQQAAQAGLDLAHPFAVGWFNGGVEETERLQDFGSSASLGILLGNSRAVWPVFMQRVEADPKLYQAAHPLDTYVEQTAALLLAGLEPIRAHAYFAHVTRPRAVPMQRLAEAVGFAGLGPVQLSIHPRLGPWFAMRIVLVVDVPGPGGAPPAVERPCQGCSRPCVAPFQRALESSEALGVRPRVVSRRAVAEHAERWIAVRDACPVGRGFRYGEQQLAYHYGYGRSAAMSRKAP
jgi:methylmalonic aciduria homocystinuria type C protein